MKKRFEIFLEGALKSGVHGICYEVPWRRTDFQGFPMSGGISITGLGMSGP